MVDLALPKPIGIPMNDVTKTAAVPTTQTQPVQPAPAIPVDQAVDKAAREAEKFAWSPDQGKQVSGIMDTQRNEYNQRADRVAKNQMTQQTLTEIERVKGLIAAEVEAIRVLTGEISTINGEISRINSEISSTQSAINSARAEVTSINSAPVAVPASPATSPSYSAPSQGQVTPWDAQTQSGSSPAYAIVGSPEYSELYRYSLVDFMPRMWKAEEEALRAINAYKSVHGNLNGIDVKGVRAKYGSKYGVDIVGDAAEADPKIRRYRELIKQAGGMDPTNKVDQKPYLQAYEDWKRSTGGDWRTWSQADFRKNGYL